MVNIWDIWQPSEDMKDWATRATWMGKQLEKHILVETGLEMQFIQVFGSDKDHTVQFDVSIDIPHMLNRLRVLTPVMHTADMDISKGYQEIWDKIYNCIVQNPAGCKNSYQLAADPDQFQQFVEVRCTLPTHWVPDPPFYINNADQHNCTVGRNTGETTNTRI